MNSPLLNVSDALCRISRRHTLKVSEFSIRTGEHWCVFGGNGAGKSLLAKLVSGELIAGRSHVEYESGFSPEDDILIVSFEEQQKLWALDNRHDISEFSDSAQDQGTTVAALILGAAVPDSRFDALLLALDLLPLQHRGIRFLSSGQVRKALIARALYRRPRLLILDDPLESVDRDSQRRITEVLRHWLGPENSTLLLCRREQDLLPGITHLALMENLSLGVTGQLALIQTSEDYARIAHRVPKIPVQLPPLIQGAKSLAHEGSEPSIELREVTAGYNGKVVLDRLSWIMQRAHHTLIEGPNGSGKSTLLSLIDGENHKAYGQEVYLFGSKRGSGETLWDVKARFGIVSNELHNKYVKGWKVIDVVVSGFFDSVGLYDDSGASERTTALAWLRIFGVEALAADYYHELSFGQQRVVLLARAMVKHPAILILDEPTVGLDDYFRTLILATVDLIAATTATQIIYVSHTAGEKPTCINQKLLFADGKVTVHPPHGYRKSKPQLST